MNSEPGTNYTPTSRSTGPLPTGGAFATRRAIPLSLEAFHKLNDWKSAVNEAQLRHLAWFGALAPTTYNSTPQRLRLDANNGALTVCLDRRAVLPAADPTGRQAVISLGCVIHNIVLAAGCYGLDVAVEVRGDVETTPLGSERTGSASVVPVARVELTPRGDADHESWLATIHERKTVRALYRQEVLTRATVASMRAYVGRRYPRLSIRVVTDGAAKKGIGRSLESAMARRLNTPRFAEELGTMLLANDDRHATVGMRGYEWGLNDDQIQTVRQGLLGQRPFTPQEKAVLAVDEREMLANSASVSVLFAERDDVVGWVDAGRAFQDIALHQWRDGLYACIHSSLVELPESAASLRAQLRQGGVPLVVFRSGRLRYPAHGKRPHASRPRVDDLILTTCGSN